MHRDNSSDGEGQDTVHCTDADYLPIVALPYWDTIGSFVRESVRDALSGTERSERDLYAAATPLVLWAWRARGTPLERKRIFRRSLIEQFIHLGMPEYARGSRATIRSTLWRMAEALNPDESAGAHRKIPRSDATAPYSPSEVAELVSWATTQGTAARRRNATALLCLGLGAGLATSELLDVQAVDITVNTSSARPEARVVVWRARPRVVPVQSNWVRPLAALIHGFEPDAWVFRQGRTGTSPGQVTDFLTRARSPLDVRPARMRATWLVQRLQQGTSPDELLRISGLKTFAALDKLAPFLQKPAHRKSSSENL